MDYNKKAIYFHKKQKGKIEIRPKIKLGLKNNMALAYTPGVGAVATAISKDKMQSWQLTNRANQVAIITDGTAVLGLGDIGPEAAMPVMEGKAVIFKEFAGIDAFPLCIGSQDENEIIKFCKLIEPSFGGINIEDISAPRCFNILAKLEKELSIPVFHDDQDGTAIVVLAALINSCRILGRSLRDLKIVINGAGSAGIAIAKLLIFQGLKNIIVLDSRGIICDNRKDLNKYKQEIARKTNKRKIEGGLEDAIRAADIFIGVSRGGLLTEINIRTMNSNPIIFALANPIPEIDPKSAEKAGAAIIGTGRSDFPNQINNALVFPGVFRGLLDYKIKNITPEMKTKIALAIAYSVKPDKKRILPPVADRKAVKNIIKAMRKS
jgi:malate dehydrogenase (oxaloacetate-decarboxylating)